MKKLLAAKIGRILCIEANKAWKKNWPKYNALMKLRQLILEWAKMPDKLPYSADVSLKSMEKNEILS